MSHLEAYNPTSNPAHNLASAAAIQVQMTDEQKKTQKHMQKNKHKQNKNNKYVSLVVVDVLCVCVTER